MTIERANELRGTARELGGYCPASASRTRTDRFFSDLQLHFQRQDRESGEVVDVLIADNGALRKALDLAADIRLDTQLPTELCASFDAKLAHLHDAVVAAGPEGSLVRAGRELARAMTFHRGNFIKSAWGACTAARLHLEEYVRSVAASREVWSTVAARLIVAGRCHPALESLLSDWLGLALAVTRRRLALAQGLPREVAHLELLDLAPPRERHLDVLRGQAIAVGAAAGEFLEVLGDDRLIATGSALPGHYKIFVARMFIDPVGREDVLKRLAPLVTACRATRGTARDHITGLFAVMEELSATGRSDQAATLGEHLVDKMTEAGLDGLRDRMIERDWMILPDDYAAAHRRR